MTLPRSAYWMYADARCSAQITGEAGIGPHLGQRALQPFASGSEGAERIADPDAPVGAGDELARNAGALRQAGLMQPESKLDDVWDAFAGRALALLVLERVGVAACGKEALLQVIHTDHAEMLGGDRLGVLAHRGQ